MGLGAVDASLLVGVGDSELAGLRTLVLGQASAVRERDFDRLEAALGETVHDTAEIERLVARILDMERSENSIRGLPPMMETVTPSMPAGVSAPRLAVAASTTRPRMTPPARSAAISTPL